MERSRTHVMYHLRVVFACMTKDITSALTERTATMIAVVLPVNILILLSLFALSNGGLAPTAVVMQENGPYAQQFYTAMAQAHSFLLRKTSPQEAHDLIKAGRIVAVVTIPADFDTRLQQKQKVEVEVEIDNLNVDFTADIRRAVPLSTTLFYGKVFPHLVTITPREHDLQAHDTDYISFLIVSILVAALMLGGLLQAGAAAAREWERATIKELLLSPASRLAITVGKMAGALVMSVIPATVALAILTLIYGVWPVHWSEALGFMLLTVLIFVAWGTLLGTLVKGRRAFTVLATGSTFPLFFLSGAFGPLSLVGSQTSIANVLAQIFPVYYSIVLMQHAFHGFDLNPYGVGTNVVILCGYAALVVILTALVVRRSTMAR